ncbi:MAG: SWIM zinc finger domain-containing protein [Oscillospiraceae bacterium]
MNCKDIINEEYVRSQAPNPAAFSNAQKISRSGDFSGLSITADNTLIFGDCKGSGKNPYRTSADFSGDTPVFRCTCPSRQFPCKHSLALMLEMVNGKEFAVGEVPEDVASKREKIAKKAEKAASGEPKSPPKQNKSAAAKKLKKQAEGLDLAEQFLNDIFSRGVSSINKTSAEQYKTLAKQLGEFYLPEPQTIVEEIVTEAEILSEQPDDSECMRLVGLCVKLSSTVKKSRVYINEKLESGEVLPEDSVLYEAMGGIWKLNQLKEIGLFKENARIMQLSFTTINDLVHQAYVDTGYWIDLDSGEISKTENIRPLKLLKRLQADDSKFGVYSVPELYRYPGGLNRRIRWENATNTEATSKDYEKVISLAEPSIADAVKKAKNELKNTLSDETVAVLVPFDYIGFAEDGHAVLKNGDESISLRANENYHYDYFYAIDVLRLTKIGDKGAVLGEMFYSAEERRIYLCPLSIVTADGVARLV